MSDDRILWKWNRMAVLLGLAVCLTAIAPGQVYAAEESGPQGAGAAQQEAENGQQSAGAAQQEAENGQPSVGTAQQILGRWQQDTSGWRYIQPDGTPAASGWLSVDGTWYWFDGQGYMKTGWLFDGGRTYYMEESGAMALGWRQIDGNWYYFHEDGGMNTGDVTLGDADCRFGADGVFLGASRMRNTGGGAYEIGCYDEATQALFDEMNEEKREEFYDEYSDREDEYDGDESVWYDRDASFQVNENLNRAAAHRLAAATEAGYGNGHIPGEGELKDYLTSIGYRPHSTYMELYLPNCEDESDAYSKFESKMMDRYERKADRKYLPEYYREAGIAHLEEGGKHFFLIIMMR